MHFNDYSLLLAIIIPIANELINFIVDMSLTISCIGLRYFLLLACTIIVLTKLKVCSQCTRETVVLVICF